MAAGTRLEDGSLDLTQSLEDDPLLEAQLLPQHPLHVHFRPRFHALPTVIIANLLLLIHVVFVVLAFLTGLLCSYPNPNEDKCPGNYINPFKVQTVVILGKVILWVLHVLLERYIQYHHSRVRKRGYIIIYRSTRHLKRLSLMIHSTGSSYLKAILVRHSSAVSVRTGSLEVRRMDDDQDQALVLYLFLYPGSLWQSGNAALLLILCIQHSFPDHGPLYLDFILAVLALELICSLICLVIYTVKIRRFNKTKPRPDIIEEENMYTYANNSTSETGFRTYSSLEEVVEKQGDIIEYLKRHNALLSKRLLAFTSPDSASQPSRE